MAEQKQKQTDRQAHEAHLTKKIEEIHQPKVDAAKKELPKGGAK